MWLTVIILRFVAKTCSAIRQHGRTWKLMCSDAPVDFPLVLLGLQHASRSCQSTQLLDLDDTAVRGCVKLESVD